MSAALQARYRLPAASDAVIPPTLGSELDRLVDELRFERYAGPLFGHREAASLLRRAYYAARPLLPVTVRSRLQRRALRGWEDLPFPTWPVDATAEQLLEGGLLAVMRCGGVEEVPFVWFWPDGKKGCVTMTHDVETGRGRDYTASMIEIERREGFVASYEIVPECRYDVPPEYLGMIRDAECEVCVHDLNHDGRLFADQSTFDARIDRVNEYGRRFGARGFRSAVMYRRSEWMPRLRYSYDMSFPNVGHLDPQRGGCCTVFPYFIDHLLELPLTATQDYTQLHVLSGDALDLWRRQADLVLAQHGLLSFIIHPDYVIEPRGAELHRRLLAMLRGLVEERDLWSALPGEIDRWWRTRAAMELVQMGGRWVVVGPGSERAHVAWARISGDGVEVEL